MFFVNFNGLIISLCRSLLSNVMVFSFAQVAHEASFARSHATHVNMGYDFEETNL